MAIPFNIPEDQNEVEVIINQLQTLLTKLQAAVRRSRGVQNAASSSQTTAPRVRSGISSRARIREEAPTTSALTSTNFPDLLNSLWVAAASQNAVASVSPQLTANSITRSSRRRTSSESSCCEETKICITAIVNQGNIQNCNQGEASIGPEGASGDGIFSKLVPSQMSAPLWTAMICFVGWHLFRAR